MSKNIGLVARIKKLEEHVQVLEGYVSALDAHKDAIHERLYILERSVQKGESGLDYISRVIDDMKRDIDVWR
jgi:hypothetical protein